jgi:hypothetical protein
VWSGYQSMDSKCYGSKETIEQVIEELGPEIKLMLGIS